MITLYHTHQNIMIHHNQINIKKKHPLKNQESKSENRDLGIGNRE